MDCSRYTAVFAYPVFDIRVIGKYLCGFKNNAAACVVSVGFIIVAHGRDIVCFVREIRFACNA